MAALWHKKDDQFWVPKGTFQAYVITYAVMVRTPLYRAYLCFAVRLHT